MLAANYQILSFINIWRIPSHFLLQSDWELPTWCKIQTLTKLIQISVSYSMKNKKVCIFRPTWHSTLFKKLNSFLVGQWAHVNRFLSACLFVMNWQKFRLENNSILKGPFRIIKFVNKSHRVSAPGVLWGQSIILSTVLFDIYLCDIVFNHVCYLTSDNISSG